MLDDQIARTLIDRDSKTPGSLVAGRSTDELFEALEPRRGPERLLDLMLRTGPYGDGFGARAEGVTLAKLEQAPHGIDFGPLQPRLPDALRTASGTIELAPQPIVDDVERLRASLQTAHNGGLVLIGRRQLRSNNSWMHNLPVLVKGKPRCTLHVHPEDAARLELLDGEPAEVRSRTGTVVAQVEVTDAVMPGVVSLPHGWGHDAPGAAMSVAAEHAGTNSNVLADDLLVDALSGNAVLNGIPVELAAVRESAVAS
jgi:anaerobic selenocysteine-containing dehydrogenase